MLETLTRKVNLKNVFDKKLGKHLLQVEASASMLFKEKKQTWYKT